MQNHREPGGEGASVLQEITRLNKEGFKHWDHNRFHEAELCFRRVCDLMESEFGSDHPKLFEAFNLVGCMLHEQGLYTKGESFYMRSLSLVERCLCPNHPRMSKALYNLGTSFHAQEKYDEAERYYLQAIQAWDAAPGRDGMDKIYTYDLYLKLLEDAGRTNEVKTLAKHLCEIGAACHAQDKYNEAERYYLKAIQAWHSAQGQDGMDKVYTYDLYMKLLEDAGRVDEAKALAKRLREHR